MPCSQPRDRRSRSFRVCFPARCHLFVASGRHACDDILRRAHGCDRTAPAMVSGSMGCQQESETLPRTTIGYHTTPAYAYPRIPGTTSERAAIFQRPARTPWPSRPTQGPYCPRSALERLVEAAPPVHVLPVVAFRVLRHVASCRSRVIIFDFPVLLLLRRAGGRGQVLGGKRGSG